MDYPPTAGEYAWSAAMDAQRANRSNNERINELETEVEELRAQLEQVILAIHELARRPSCVCGPSA